MNARVVQRPHSITGDMLDSCECNVSGSAKGLTGRRGYVEHDDEEGGGRFFVGKGIVRAGCENVAEGVGLMRDLYAGAGGDRCAGADYGFAGGDDLILGRCMLGGFAAEEVA